MATSSQAASAATAAVIGSLMSTTSQTIVGSHVFRIEGFSATKDLGVDKCIKSSTFSVGGHVWYIECYPCGVHDGRADSVYLKLCRQEDHSGSSRLSGDYEFTLMKSLKDGSMEIVYGSSWFTFDDRRSLVATDFIERDLLESLLKDDRFVVRCLVFINKFPAVPQQDLAPETVAGSHSHVLTVEGYSKILGAYTVGEKMDSRFRFAGRGWLFRFYPSGEEGDETSAISADIYLDSDDPAANNEVTKVRLDMTLLTLAGPIISLNQDFYTFSEMNPVPYRFDCLLSMEHESSPLLQDGIQIRCDMAIVNGITAVQPMPDLHQLFGDLLETQVGTDVTFDVSGNLFSAHKCVLATQSTAFMAEFFGPPLNGTSTAVTRVQIDGIEPRVFKALLHFIYTDALPEVREEDKILMAQGLLVAADGYGMERLKLICGDMLCSYINDARTAITTLDIADKHGCRGLMEACKKFLMDQFAKDAP